MRCSTRAAGDGPASDSLSSSLPALAPAAGPALAPAAGPGARRSIRSAVAGGWQGAAIGALLCATSAAQGALAVEVLGSHCGGIDAAPPSLAASQVLRLGGTSLLTATNLPVPATGVLLAGWATDQWGPLALPLPLASLGMHGCSLHVRPDVHELFSGTDSFYQWQLDVPFVPVLQGRELGAQVMFVDPAANPRGIGATPGLGLRIQPRATPTQVLDRVTQNGITFVFAHAVEVGQFVNGDWFVVGPVPVIDMLPTVASLNGRVLHGAMVNPDPSTVEQGYDSQLFTAQFASHYRPALNRALGVSALSPLQLLPGQALVKVESHPVPPGVPMLRRAAVLTVVDAVPFEGSFRPPYAGRDHAVRHHTGMLDWNRLRNLAPAPGMTSPAEIGDRLRRVWLDHCPSWTGRMMHPSEHMPDYGRDLAALLGEAALLANCALADAERLPIVYGVVQIGIDCFGNVRNGCRWSGLGGHASGRKLPILFAGALLGDQSMLAVGQTHVSRRLPDGTVSSWFGEDTQTFVVEETSPGVFNFGYGGYASADVGMPEYGFSHVSAPQNDHRDWGADSYRICCTANGWVGHVLTARLMGLTAAWHHQVLFDYTDRYMATQPSGWTRSWRPWVEVMWDLYRSQF